MSELNVRIRIKKKDSHYYDLLAWIVGSNCDGTFRVVVCVEGKPTINLYPEHVEPC